jgi:hypothetical protein
MECGGAREAPGCGRGAAELANGGEQRRRRRRSGGDAEWRRSRGSEMRPRDEVKEVDEDSWACGGTNKGHERAGGATGDRRRDVARRRKASKGRARGGWVSWRARWWG